MRDPYRKVRGCVLDMRKKNEDDVVESPNDREKVYLESKPESIGAAHRVNNSDIGGIDVRHLQILITRRQKADALNDKDFRPSSSVAR